MSIVASILALVKLTKPFDPLNTPSNPYRTLIVV